MADKVKKAETTAKPRKTPVKTKKTELTPVATMVSREATLPSREEIQRLAHKYWAQRGYQHGGAEQDWFRAEQELRQKAS